MTFRDNCKSCDAHMTVSDPKPGWSTRWQDKWQAGICAPNWRNCFRGVTANAKVKETERKCESSNFNDNSRCPKAKGRPFAGQITYYLPFPKDWEFHKKPAHSQRSPWGVHIWVSKTSGWGSGRVWVPPFSEAVLTKLCFGLAAWGSWGDSASFPRRNRWAKRVGAATYMAWL